MREPSTNAYDWHAGALAHFAAHGTLRGVPGGLHEDEYHCGWFKRRLVSRGPWLPASVYLEAPFDPETGELTGDETFACEVMGEARDIRDEWSWICGRPISRETYVSMLEILFTGEFA